MMMGRGVLGYRLQVSGLLWGHDTFLYLVAPHSGTSAKVGSCVSFREGLGRVEGEARANQNNAPLQSMWAKTVAGTISMPSSVTLGFSSSQTIILLLT